MTSETQKQYFHTLGLHPGATQDEIRAAYQRLSLAFHPDKHPELGPDTFARIHQAYSALCRHQNEPVAMCEALPDASQPNNNRRAVRRGEPSHRRFESISEPDYKGTRVKISI